MKKILLLCVLLSILLLSACTVGGEKPDEPPAEHPYQILINGDASVDVSKVVTAITADSGKMVNIFTDQRDPGSAELVFGSTNRSVSALAMSVLEAAIAADADADVGYVIYKGEDGNVAVVWSEQESAALAVESFARQYAHTAFLKAAVAGKIEVHVFNLEAYLYSTAWAALEAEAPADVVAALKSLAEMYDGSAITDWLASLWEPYHCACGKCRENGAENACYGGAFYYAISSRDNDGFWPDVESTSQALGWLSSNGAFENYRDSYTHAISARMKELIVIFCQQLQSEKDGYFYHPQWGSGVSTERSGRDLSSATALLRNCGGKPLYPTALDRLQGRGVSAHLTTPLRCGSASDAVMPTASIDNYLKSPEKFLSWLKNVTNGDDMFYNSAGAHTINAVKSQIYAAGYNDILLDYLEAQQEKLFLEMKAAHDADPVNNPEPTGLWQRTIDYNAVWGLLKLAPFYSEGNREIKYAEYAMKTCVGCILISADEGGSYHANDLMNQWSSANMLIINIRKHNPVLVERLYEIARENAPAMIAESKAKIARFIHADGTFGYNQGTSAPYTQGTRVSLGLPEGDVNATSLICTMYRCCFTVLGYNEVPLCDYRDGERFLAEIERKNNEAYGVSAE